MLSYNVERAGPRISRGLYSLHGANTLEHGKRNAETCPLTPAEENEKKGRVFTRMSDVTTRYVVRAKCVAEEQYASFRSALSKTMQRRPG